MTKYYVDTNGNYIGGFDGSEPPSGSLEIPDAPGHALDKWINNSWVIFIDYKTQALSALSKKDLVVNRCFEQGVTLPQEWRDYAENLRQIVGTGIGPLPEQPDYPAGT